jgi:hypothetical protein
MLTMPLVRVRRVGPEIVPRYLTRMQRQRLEPVAAALCAVMHDAQGLRRDELDRRLDAIEPPAADTKVVAGLRKLLLDRAELELPPGPDPALLRERLFTRAAARRRALEPGERFDRAAMVCEVAADLGIDGAALDEQLFADLAGNERLVAYRPLGPGELLDRYDVALAQAVLLSATRVDVMLEGEAAGRVRAIFHAVRFRGLVHRVTALGDGYRIELDGPLSLFGAVQRYGLELALFLPTLLTCEHWSLEAELAWGRGRERARFRLGPGAGLRAPARSEPIPVMSRELTELCDGFRALGSSWEVARADRIFALPGQAVCVPDLAFTHRTTGEVVYLELFGFWSRAAVWQRIEAVRAGLDVRIILCIGKHLRVSEQVLDAEDAAELYVYKTRPSPRAILERLERAGRPTA